MNRLTARLPVLQTAIIPSDDGGPVPRAAIGDVVALIRAITRKAKFADMHMALLSGIDWERYDDLGRRPVGELRTSYAESATVRSVYHDRTSGCCHRSHLLGV